MIAPSTDSADIGPLIAAGLPEDEVTAWLREMPEKTSDFAADRTKFSDFWQISKRLAGRLPQKPRRSEREQLACALLDKAARNARARFLRRHSEAVYDALTGSRSRFVRVEELVIRAAEIVP